ncbi:MAG: OmpA family protein [Bryobacteraceae bacterium]
MLAGGCATKKYVRQTTAPIQAKVDQVGEQTTKQGQEIQDNRSQIKQVDERAQSGISAAQERASAADAHAGDAMNRANQANLAASQNSEAIASLRQVVSNLDDYRMQNEVTIPFKFDQAVLSREAEHDLDQLASSVQGKKRYFIAVEGYTDGTGTARYNAALSRRRADAVVQYLVAKHDIPVFRIHQIGLGSEKPIESGRSRAARAKNRRVEVKLFTAGQNLQGGPSTTAMSPAQPQR